MQSNGPLRASFLPVAAGAIASSEETVSFHRVGPREPTLPPQDVHKAGTATPAPAPTLSTLTSSSTLQTGAIDSI